MQRIPEPELMEDLEQAMAYDHADFTQPNARFLELYDHHVAQHLDHGPHRVLDIGCGPATICLDIAQRWPQARLSCVDGSEAMIQRAAKRLAAHPELAGRVDLVCEAVPLPHGALEGAFDAVLSNSLLHHLHDPSVLWREILVQAKPGGFVLVGDLTRPASAAQAASIVQTHAAQEPEVLRTDFYNSLLAAFTPDEVRAQLVEAGLTLTVDRVSDRHMIVWGQVPG